MNVAILLPSRARPDRLHKTIHSAYDTASNFEIIVRLDNDDCLTLDRIDEFKNYDKVKIHIGPRKKGWCDLNLFYTEMANLSNAEWISIMNDDAIYEGKGWDSMLFDIPKHGYIVQPELYQLGYSKYYHAEGGAFPFVPNKCWEQYGYDIIPDPVDLVLDNILRKDNGWKTHFLKGIGVIHDRDSDDILESHRKINS